MRTPEEVAQLVEQGARVFPLARHSKRPIWKDWQLDANSSQLKVVEYWANEYPGCNWAMLCGPASGRWVLDFDVKHHKPGLDVYNHWILEHGPEWTFTQRVRTPSGGLHLYFPWQEGIRRSLSSLARGVDVCGTASYVVIPPSYADGGSYYFENSNPETTLSPIPQWLLGMVQKIIVEFPRRFMKVCDEEARFYEGERHEHLIYYLIALRRSGATLAVLQFAAREFNKRLLPAYDDRELDRQAEDIFKRYPPITTVSTIPYSLRPCLEAVDECNTKIQN